MSADNKQTSEVLQPDAEAKATFLVSRLIAAGTFEARDTIMELYH